MSLRRTFEDSAVQSIDEILEDILPSRESEFEREVARATGDSVSEIRRRGFVPLTPFPLERDSEDPFLDWDELELQRNF